MYDPHVDDEDLLAGYDPPITSPLTERLIPCNGCGAVGWYSPAIEPRCPRCKPAVCEYPQCGATEGVAYEGSRTAYCAPRLNAWTRLLLEDEIADHSPDPNTGMWLCREHARDYQEYWDEMWEHARPQL